MNFKRIEWIFLIAFIALDIFLVISYIKQNDIVQSTTNTALETSTSAILKNIRSEQISYGNLTTKTATGFYVASPDEDVLKKQIDKLHFQTDQYSNHRLIGTFSAMIEIKNHAKPQQTLDEIVVNKDLILYGNQYKYSSQLSTRNTIVYVQQICGKPVLSENGQIRFIIKDGWVTGYTQGYVAHPSELREQQTTISEERAVIWLYQYRKIPSNSKILWGELGYTNLLSVNNNIIYIPTWVFAIQNESSGTIQYRKVNAFNGVVIDNDSAA